MGHRIVKGLDPYPPTRPDAEQDGAEVLRVAIVQMDDLERARPNIHSKSTTRAFNEATRLLIEVRDKAATPSSGSQAEIRGSIRAFADHALKTFRVIENKRDSRNLEGPVWRRIGNALCFCARQRAEAVVFPEYSIPPGLLPKIDRLCRRLFRDEQRPFIVVAGTFYPDEYGQAYCNGHLEELGLDPLPDEERRAHAPVFVRDGQDEPRWYLIPKIAPSDLEQQFGFTWEPSDFGWNPIMFRERRVAVQICSDYAVREPPEHFTRVATLINASVSLILVPARNPRFQDFTSEFEKHWHYKRKTVYANFCGMGESLILGTDERIGRREVDPLVVDQPFGVNCGPVFRMPQGSEGVMITDIFLMDRVRADTLIAVAPLIDSWKCPKLCESYKRYRHAANEKSKRNCLSEYAEGKECERERQLALEADETLLYDKLAEMSAQSPFCDLVPSKLDLIADVIQLRSPARPARGMCGMWNGLRTDALDIAKLTNEDRLWGSIIKFADYCRKQEQAWHKTLPPDEEPGTSTVIKPVGPSGGAPRVVPIDPESRTPLALILDAFETHLALVLGSTQDRHATFTRRALQLLLRLLEQDSARLTVFTHAYNTGDTKGGFFDVYEFIKAAEPVHLASRMVIKSRAEPQRARETMEIQGGVDETLVERWFASYSQWASLVIEKSHAQLGDGFDLTSEEPGHADREGQEQADRLWRQIESLRFPALATGSKWRRTAMLELIETAEAMLSEQAHLAVCSLDPEKLGKIGETSDFLLKGSTLLELLARSIILVAYKQEHGGEAEDPSLVFAAIAVMGVAYKGQSVRILLRQFLRRERERQPNRDFGALLQKYAVSVEAMVKQTCRTATEVLDASENQDVGAGDLQEMGVELFKKVSILHLLLAKVEEIVKEPLD